EQCGTWTWWVSHSLYPPYGTLWRMNERRCDMPLNHTHATQILIPGWHGSGPDHWQQHWWRSASGSRLLEQDDWLTPRRHDWVKRLDDTVQTTPGPVVLVAHSLGCITV